MPVISVRIDKKVKEILDRAGINVTEEVKKYLNELAWKIEIKERIERFKTATKDIKPAEKGYSAKSVREDRESH